MKRAKIKTQVRRSVLGLSAGLATFGAYLAFFVPTRLYRDYGVMPLSARYGPGMEALVYGA